MTEISKEIATKFYTEMTNTDLDFKALTKNKSIEFENAFRNGKLYIQCGYHVKDDVKKLGAKWDNNIKMWYITKYNNKENIKKMLKIEKRLFGRNTTIGYIDYKYDVICPKWFVINYKYGTITISPKESYTSLPEKQFFDMSMSETEVINIIHHNDQDDDSKNVCMF